MTHPTDPLHEPLRLLRETSLPAGFEERLAERLAHAQREGVVRPHRFGGHRRTLLLLAAIALPAAAFASGGWLLEHRQTSTAPQIEAPREAKPLPRITQKPLSQPAPVILPQLPAVEELSVSEPSGLREPARSTPDSKSRADQDSKRAQGFTRDQELKRASASPNKTPTTQTPAKIESLEIAIPRADKAKGSEARGTEKPPSSLGLRRSSEQGASRSSVEREHSSAQRESIGQQRGSDAAQQARERVQARERKGQ